jgi:cytochrome d ubiquinol oxidase subunit I
LLRTAQGYSVHVSAGNSLFTLLGFLGIYSLLSILWIVLVYRTIEAGPGTPEAQAGPLVDEPASTPETINA